jgi:hypothetical protein
MFLPTNHKSEDLDELKLLAQSDTFSGFRIRIIDESGRVMFEPETRDRSGEFGITDIANMLNVPVIDPPAEFFEDPERFLREWEENE